MRQGSSSGLHFRCNFKVQLTGFATGLDAGNESKRGVKDDLDIFIQATRGHKLSFIE